MLKHVKATMMVCALMFASVLGAGCGVSGEEDYLEPIAAPESDEPATTVDAEQHAGVRSVLNAIPGAESGPSAAAVCIRDPFGPGKVIWQNNPGSDWRSEIENGSQWVGAGGTQGTDGIHRDGWGCTVYKVPDHCTLTVTSGGTLDCCCNAAASVFQGRCRWVNYSDIGAPRPPGCS